MGDELTTTQLIIRRVVITGLVLGGIAVVAWLGLQILVGLHFQGLSDTRREADEAATRQAPARSPAMPLEGLPDGAPPQADINNAWKHRAEVSPADHDEGQAAAKRIRAALRPLHKSGRYDSGTIHDALRELGYAAEDLEVSASQSPNVSDPERFVSFGVRVAPSACVVGGVDPKAGVRTEVDGVGTEGEFTCLEPFSH